VIGLDTPVLLGLLEGRPATRILLRSLAGEELATTEVNLFELEAVARRISRPGRERRVAAVERLRRALTVLPIDERGARRAAELAAAAPGVASPTALMLGAMEVHGCTQWITARGVDIPRVGLRLKVKVA
jgi:predicted nucleic acid-binding protein